MVVLACEGAKADLSHPDRPAETVKDLRISFGGGLVGLPDGYLADIQSMTEDEISFRSESGVGEIEGSIDRVSGKVVFSIKNALGSSRWNLACKRAKPIF